MTIIHIALAQMAPITGGIRENASKILRWYDEQCMHADLMVTPELSLSGYPCADLYKQPRFVRACWESAMHIAAMSKKMAVGFGLPVELKTGHIGNAYAVARNGKLVHLAGKMMLPHDGVFDEKRYFMPFTGDVRLCLDGMEIGFSLCEDLWHEDRCKRLCEEKVDLIISPHASPYRRGVWSERAEVARQRLTQTKAPIILINRTGGQDELVFDGASFAQSITGTIGCRLPAFEEGCAVVTLRSGVFTAKSCAEVVDSAPCAPQKLEFAEDKKADHPTRGHFYQSDVDDQLANAAADYHACLLGLRDYVYKAGFSRILLGLSGGIDSALVAILACDALGAENIRGYMLYTPYTSAKSRDIAQDLASRMGFFYQAVDLEPFVQSFNGLKPMSDLELRPIVRENMQARLRGMLLMALSNQYDDLLLSTGNKSEVAVGYATLYGDMCGAYNPIKDIYKTSVYAMARWRNANQPSLSAMKGKKHDIFSNDLLERAPSAELAPDQKDQDSLPPYEVLDRLLYAYIEEDKTPADLHADKMGTDEATIRHVWQLLHGAEHKRFQSPPGPKCSRRAFGHERRYPLQHAYIK